MLTIDVEKANDVAVVHCGGRLVRGAEVARAARLSPSATSARSTCSTWSPATS